MKQRRDYIGSNNPSYKHGGRYTKLYTTWLHMKQRCFNPKIPQYKDWGGRGITICPEWTNDYTKFRDWALSNGYAEGLQINRINNNGNYEPNNCNFVTAKENNRNRRTTKFDIEIANKIREEYKTSNYSLRDLAKIYNTSFGHISDIINNRKWKNN